MIKLLSILGAAGLTASAPSGVVACGMKQPQTPVASSVDENGTLTSEFKMKLKKDSVSFQPLNMITLPDDSDITISGLVLMNTDIDSEIKPNNKISKTISGNFTVKYKDIKDNLNSTRDKLTKDLNIKVHLIADVKHLESELNPKTVIMNIANDYDNKISGKTVAMVVNLPRLLTPVTPDIIPEPIPEPIVPVPDYPIPEPIKPMPMPQPVPDKPDHYIPGIIPYSNADLGLVSAGINEGGTIVTAYLTKAPYTKINKNQIVLTNQLGEKLKVIFVQSDTDTNEIDLVLDNPVTKDQQLTLAILGIGQFDGLTNCVKVDMSGCKYTPSSWLQWESIWSLTKKACYYGTAFSWYTFKLSVRVAWLLCPCSWPCEIATTAMDLTWVPRYILDWNM